MMPERSTEAAYLVATAAMTATEALALSDEQLVEHVLGIQGFAVLSQPMAALFESVELRISIGADVSWGEFEAVLFAVYSGPYGDYHRALTFA
jgi:hypothetical protein